MVERVDRFPPIHKPNTRNVVLFDVNPTFIFCLGFLPPLAGVIMAIGTALTVHQDAVINYKWTCGRAFLPSFSRIINLDFEGTIWQLLVLFHVPVRICELTVQFFRYDRLHVITKDKSFLYAMANWSYLIFGGLEITFLVLLSTIGEKENGRYHIACFYLFGIFSFIHFLANIICHRQSSYYFQPYGKTSYKLKVWLCSAYILSVPLIATFFVLYWKACITLAYELFAFVEYVDIFINLCFHGCALFDFRHKVAFRLSYTPRSARRAMSRPTDELQGKTED